MEAKGFYNLKLAMSMEDVSGIVPNDLTFDRQHTVYILTGANRGGKTTVTQAVGQLFVLAQGGLFVPAESFRYVPCDCIYTHFPADEDKTMDLGRLGEECRRFRELYTLSTGNSLLLLESGFHIALVIKAGKHDSRGSQNQGRSKGNRLSSPEGGDFQIIQQCDQQHKYNRNVIPFLSCSVHLPILLAKEFIRIKLVISSSCRLSAA